jgi:hypothetical protein
MLSRYITEKQAWKWIAEQFADSNLKNSDYFQGVIETRQEYRGICRAVYALADGISWLFGKRIDCKAAASMIAKIRICHNQTALDGTDYIWPLTREGHANRVAFCLEQIRLIEEAESCSVR